MPSLSDEVRAGFAMGRFVMVFDPKRSAVIVTNPTDDGSFETFVRETYVSVNLEASRVAVGRLEPSALERVIRSRYPEAVVRARDLSGELLTVWYVYRDGRWRPPGPPAKAKER